MIIQTIIGPQEAPAYPVGDGKAFGVFHRSKQHPELRYWSLSHVPTGRHIATVSTLQRGLELGQKLLELPIRWAGNEREIAQDARPIRDQIYKLIDPYRVKGKGA